MWTLYYIVYPIIICQASSVKYIFKLSIDIIILDRLYLCHGNKQGANIMATLKLATVRTSNKNNQEVLFTFHTALEAQNKAQELMKLWKKEKNQILCKWETHETVNLQNGDVINDYDDECPVHLTLAKREYRFGGFESPIITTHNGCSCCALSQTWQDTKYFTTYAEAQSNAELKKAIKNSKGI